MQEDKEIKNSKALEKELRERLDWYAMHASDEEYDEKAVEYILYLLDSLEPLGEDVIPPVDEAWGRFQEIAESGQELLPLEADRIVPDSGTAGKKGRKAGRAGKLGRFVARHKLVAAIVVLAVILAVGGTIQAGAKRSEGFFFWLNRDDSGTQMVTSPEDLDDVTSKNENIFYNRDEVPEWTRDWIEIEVKVEMPENYSWQYFETESFENMQSIISHYFSVDAKKEISLGMRMYLDKISYNRDKFIDYDFISSYEINQIQMNVYSKIEESGKNYYAISFYLDNCLYFVEGQNDLEEIKSIMEQYWNFVKNN